MSKLQQFQRGGRTAVWLPLLVALVALLLMWGHADREPALAQGPAMSLNAPASVATGEMFTVINMADPAPDIEISGFGSEILFPGGQESPISCVNSTDDDGDGAINDGCEQVAETSETGAQCANDTDDDGDGFVNDGCPTVDAAMEWLQRPNCEDEVMVEPEDGGPLILCLTLVSALSGGVVYGVLGDFGEPPLSPLTLIPGSTAPLIELDFRCLTAGSHTFTLMAVPDSADGALYAGLDGGEIWVETEQQDPDGDTTLNDVADSVMINCEGQTVPMSPSPTPTATVSGSLTPGEVEPSATQINGNDGNNGDDDDGDDGDDGISAGLWAVIAVVVAAAIAGLVVFGWRYTRRR